LCPPVKVVDPGLSRSFPIAPNSQLIIIGLGHQMGTIPIDTRFEADPIETVECFDCSVSLPRPLSVGPATVTERTYAVVRLRTRRGLEGVAYAYGRGLPVSNIIRDSFKPLLLGADSAFPNRIRERLADAFWPYGGQGLVPVAISAVDLALWDILGKRLNAPLADLLGRHSDSALVCGVAGYTRHGGNDLADLKSDLETLVAQGVRSFKLTIGADSPQRDAERVALARDIVGPEAPLAVDAFRSFRNLDDALRRLRLLQPYDLAFVEDPFPDTLPSLLAELRRRSGMLVSVGENLSDHRSYRSLLSAQAVDVIRCDATVVGGVREFMAVSALASASGMEVAPHVHPHIHIHFAVSMPNLYAGGLEYMAPSLGLDPIHTLLSSQLELRDGFALLPNRPGLGLDFNWQAVKESSCV
jgi:L-alanine-DL-glutamate epimerase-like enolase superfamily enzyme